MFCFLNCRLSLRESEEMVPGVTLLLMIFQWLTARVWLMVSHNYNYAFQMLGTGMSICSCQYMCHIPDQFLDLLQRFYQGPGTR